ncbi:MAG: aldo/keto reductase [Candidatus Amulumruptor caecigallinarius]|nr:aldo/keto reductase [Candidatus Amulumruptor caecigallinarius]
MDKNFKLYNGVNIPCIGFGTYMIPDGSPIANSVKYALDTGYRHIDGAEAYGNEVGEGRGIRESGISRKDIFVTSKVWATDRGYDRTLRAFDKTMANLNIEYLDLYLIHWPASGNRYTDWKEINRDTWKAMELLYREGQVRAIGLSNFLPHHIKALRDMTEICPMVNQIEFHPGYMQADCLQYCQQEDILVEAWSPLGRGRVLENELLRSIAERYGKSVAQVCIRWAIQHGVVPLPKSDNPNRIRENIDVFDFLLTGDEMKAIDNMPRTGWSGLHPDTVDF